MTDNLLSSYWELLVSERQIILEKARPVLVIFFATFLFSAVLEFGLCLETVRGVQKQPNGKSLYIQGWIYSICNPLFIGTPIYTVASWLLCDFEGRPPIRRQLVEAVWMIGGHAIQYYLIHKAFHEHPALYQRFHRFHHRFHTHVPPSAANAVSVGEYVFAYMFPFLLPLLLAWNHNLPIHALSVSRATWWLSITNILVHTPYLEALSQEWLPSLFVSTHNHLDHHRKLNAHYASPTFNVDNIAEWVSTQFISSKEKQTNESN